MTPSQTENRSFASISLFCHHEASCRRDRSGARCPEPQGVQGGAPGRPDPATPSLALVDNPRAFFRCFMGLHTDGGILVANAYGTESRVRRGEGRRRRCRHQ